MITLEDLKPAEGSVSKSKRVGRGRSSGHGKTSCRGHNGEGQRSGRSAKRGFEGGQMPSYRQMPKLKGFKNRFALKAAEINPERSAIPIPSIVVRTTPKGAKLIKLSTILSNIYVIPSLFSRFLTSIISF